MIEEINDALTSYRYDDLDIESARDIIILEINKVRYKIKKQTRKEVIEEIEENLWSDNTENYQISRKVWQQIRKELGK